jgi:hypothetical protein
MHSQCDEISKLQKQAAQEARNLPQPAIQPLTQGSREILGESTPRARPSTPINDQNADQIPPDLAVRVAIQGPFYSYIYI